MACVRKRRGKWVVDFRDGAGVRRWITCRTKREAEDLLGKTIRESRQLTRPVVDPSITVDAYADRWLQLIEPNVKPRTLRSYRDTLRLHLRPAIGALKVRQLHKGRVKTLLADKLAAGLSKNSVRIIHATLRAMLNAALDDGVILTNPADKLGRQLRLVRPAKSRAEEIKAMTREQLATFLAKAAAIDRRHYPLFLLLARTGMRLGEALAIQWGDIDFASREIRVMRALSAGRIETPKAGHGRTVDMSKQLSEVLFGLQVEQEAEALLHRGDEEPTSPDRETERPRWVFCTGRGILLDESKVRKAFRQIIRKANLPAHFSPHALRHTLASLLLQQGESPAYVQRQLGHASIQLTVDTYGRWLPMGNKAAVDRLDEPTGSKMVAAGPSGEGSVSEVPETAGAGGRGRTDDLLITNQLLCH